jgi:hypothetical protein
MQVFNTEQPTPSPEASMEEPMQEQTGFAPDFEEEEDGFEEVVANLEAHLNSMADDQKAFVAEYATTPEGAMLLGLINGKEVYEYFAQFIDPSKTLSIVSAEGQGPAQASPQMGQPSPSPAAPAPQGAPAQQPAPQQVFGA